MGKTLFLARSFDPEELAIAVSAYDKTIAVLGEQPLKEQEVVARQIIALLAAGERDPAGICERALKSADIPSPSISQPTADALYTDHADPASEPTRR